MSIYELTKSIHNEIERINQKLGLEIDIKNEKKIYESDWYNLDNHNLGAKQILQIDKIQAPQIRYILLSLDDIFGVMPSRKLKEYIGRDLFGMLNSWGFGKHSKIENRKAIRVIMSRIEKGDKMLEKLLADYNNTISVRTLCSRWLDGLDPLFNREPETVLSELLEELKKL